MERKNQRKVIRRRFLLRSAIAQKSSLIAADLWSKTGLTQVSAPASITSTKRHPSLPYGVASGDITGSNALNLESSAIALPACRLIVEYDTTESCQCGCPY